MRNLQNTKQVILFDGASCATNATAASNLVDMEGHHEALLLVWTESAAATNAPATLKVQHSDTTDATNFADVTGLVGGTDFTLGAVSSTTQSTIPYKLHYNRGKGKRYLRVVTTPGGTGNSHYGVAILSRSKELPDTAAEMGVTAFANA